MSGVYLLLVRRLRPPLAHAPRVLLIAVGARREVWCRSEADTTCREPRGGVFTYFCTPCFIRGQKKSDSSPLPLSSPCHPQERGSHQTALNSVARRSPTEPASHASRPPSPEQHTRPSGKTRPRKKPQGKPQLQP